MQPSTFIAKRQLHMSCFKRAFLQEHHNYQASPQFGRCCVEFDTAVSADHETFTPVFIWDFVAGAQIKKKHDIHTLGIWVLGNVRGSGSRRAIAEHATTTSPWRGIRNFQCRWHHQEQLRTLRWYQQESWLSLRFKRHPKPWTHGTIASLRCLK